MPLTLMLNRAHSTASTSVMRLIAALVIEYSAAPVAAVVERAHRGDVDDAAGQLGGDQPAGDLAGQQPRAAQVGVEHRVDQLERHLVGPLGVGDAGVVDEDRDRPDGRFRLCDGPDDALVILHVEHDGMAPPSGRVITSASSSSRSRRRPVGTTVAPAAAEHLAEPPTETRRRPGHQCDLARQIERDVGNRIRRTGTGRDGAGRNWIVAHRTGTYSVGLTRLGSEWPHRATGPEAELACDGGTEGSGDHGACRDDRRGALRCHRHRR